MHTIPRCPVCNSCNTIAYNFRGIITLAPHKRHLFQCFLLQNSFSSSGTAVLTMRKRRANHTLTSYLTPDQALLLSVAELLSVGDIHSDTHCKC